jgi:hypothetical protein
MVLVKLLKYSAVWFFIGLISTTVCADEPSATDIYSKIIRANGLEQTLNLSVALINHEIEALNSKKLKLSTDDLVNIKLQLLTRYQPTGLEVLLLNKLKNTESTSSTQLLQFYESSLAVEIHGLRAQNLQEKYQTELLEYQKKLESLPTQSHRKKLILVVDRLNRQSEWQAALSFSIQQSLYLLLPETTRKNYIFSNEETLLNEFLEFNSIINMYSLRHITSEQLILYLDELNENKVNIKAIDASFRELLQEQQSKPFTLVP